MKIRAPYLKSSRSLIILLPLLFILLHFMGCTGPFSVYKEQKGIMKTRASHTKWSLPEGAKARLNKGFIFEITYSPDSTLLAVASSIGVWLYDVAKHATCSQGIRVVSEACRLVRMDR